MASKKTAVETPESSTKSTSAPAKKLVRRKKTSAAKTATRSASASKSASKTATRSASKSATKTKTARADASAPTFSVEERAELIAVAAYLRAEARGFAPGGELDDWLVAEREVDARLALQ